MKSRSRHWAARLATIAILVTTAACGGDSEASESDSLTIGVVGTSMQVTFAPYTSVPIDRGYFEDEGLEVDVVNLPGSAEAVDAVLAGQLDAALVLSPSGLSAVESGADVTAFYNHITSNFAIPMVPEDSPIQEPADLAGSVVGVVSPGAGSTPLVKALVKREGGDPSGIDFLSVGAGPDVAEQVRAGNIDALGLWDSVYASIEGQDVPLRPVSTEWFNQLGFQGVFMAQTEDLRENPDTFARFGRAVAKSTLFTINNPDAAITSHWEVYPSSKPAGMSDEAARAVNRAALESRLPAIGKPEGGWGAAGEDEIIELQQALVGGGFLKSALPVEEVWYDDLVDQFGDFDEAEVIADAESAS